MKRVSIAVLLFMLLVSVIAPATAYGFGAGAHLLIAERVYGSRDVDLLYGSLAPDIALYVARPERWPTAFEDTHYDFADLRPEAWGPTQKAFAMGWLTHNEIWGADFYAHIEYPPGNDKGYVIEKAGILSAHTGIDPKFAHYGIETAVDLLLRNRNDRRLGEKLLFANLFRSWQDRNLMARVLVWKERRTDWFTLAAAEQTFRSLVHRYAIALSLPEPWNLMAMGELGSELALAMFGLTVSPESVSQLLSHAIELCEGDYEVFTDFVVQRIKERL